MTNTAEILSQLETTPLAGDAGRGVREQLPRAVTTLSDGPTAIDTARLLAIGARLAFASGERDALDRLGHARRAAAEAGALVLEDRLTLLSVRALARSQALQAARALLMQVSKRVERTDALVGELHLAKAGIDPANEAEHLRAALASLASPVSDHERMSASLRLGELVLAGASAEVAISHFTLARDLALKYGDAVTMSVAASNLAVLTLESGHHQTAAAHLDDAINASKRLGDDLGMVANGTVRAALHLAQAEYQEAAELARLTEEAARRRRNWIAVADAILTQSLCLSLSDAVCRLVLAARELRAMGARAAANLLTARLAEMRHLHPEKDFQAAMLQVEASID